MSPGESNNNPFIIGGEINIDILLSKIQVNSTNYGFTFIPISKYEICPIGTYKIALVMDVINEEDMLGLDDRDIHFYRQNSDGSWSHKLGNDRVYSNDQVPGSMKKITPLKHVQKIFLT